MPLYLTARNPTDSVVRGLLPAAARLGLETVLLTDHPVEHAAACAGRPGEPVAVLGADVHDAGAVAARVYELTGRFGAPQALLSNSDHLQVPTALAAGLLDLPAKPWAAALRCKNKLLTRRTLAASGLDVVAAAEIGPADDPAAAAAGVPFPAVVKPREGVASEDVVLVEEPGRLPGVVGAIRAGRPEAALLVEEYLPGPLYTFDTLGDAATLRHIGSWHTTPSPPPHFAEVRMDWAPDLPAPVREHVAAQLGALGVRLGACHTEFVRQGDRARIVEVNYRLAGDQVDFLCAELLGIDLFAAVIRVHRGEALPDLPPEPPGRRHARLDYVLADRAGTLVDAPADGSGPPGPGVRVGHRRLREPGVTAALHHSNRDYLAAVYGIGADACGVRAAVAEFRAAHAWPIAP